MNKQMKYDIVIVGAGIIGTAIASVLSKYDLSICVLEKTNDISNGASKANSGIVHAGYDAKPGTLMAKFNAEGTSMYPELCERLDVPFRPIGSYVIAFTDDDIKTLHELKERGEKNDIPDIRILSRDELLLDEPNLNPEVKAALYAATSGVVSPYELSIAFMEHAMDNGAKLMLETPLLSIKNKSVNYILQTPDNELETKIVINAAGAFGDEIHNMVLQATFKLQARRGEYFLLDKYAGDSVNHIIFQCPTDLSKGVLIAPTAHENIIIGPNAEDVNDPEAVETTQRGLDEVWDSSLKSLPALAKDQVITTFSGMRAEPSTGDFIIQDYDEAPGFIDVAGIKSPGLSAAPAIAEYVTDLVKKYIKLKNKDNYKSGRRKIVRFHTLSYEEKAALVKENPQYGRIICRCEGVTEAEIVDCIHRNAGAHTLDAVKRRTRSGGGRCQGGFCAPRIIDILSRELKIPKEQILKDSSESRIIFGKTKGESLK
ncbi:MAG: NAD(P)/FAD-dependent oxidoreductase [Candidatus Marinimicrobia bacterium]|nr:NAD(P)/FAD-dependent oxidoreductase [Candidatus Neomarinimicrobiota bacterium]